MKKVVTVWQSMNAVLLNVGSGVGHTVSQCSAEIFHNWGQCPRALEKVGTFEKKVGTLWGK